MLYEEFDVAAKFYVSTIDHLPRSRGLCYITIETLFATVNSDCKEFVEKSH